MASREEFRPPGNRRWPLGKKDDAPGRKMGLREARIPIREEKQGPGTPKNRPGKKFRRAGSSKSAGTAQQPSGWRKNGPEPRTSANRPRHLLQRGHRLEIGTGAVAHSRDAGFGQGRDR